jgi:NADH:ubiquinone oxidoreductase subunit E
LSQTTTVDDVAIIAKRWNSKRGSLIMALHDLQNRHGYVPRESAMKLAKYMDVPLARIYEVITFYNYFKLKSPGKHVVSVCMGTACYLKGAPEIFHAVSERLKIKSGETTPDGQFHLQMVRCIGCCGLSPVVTINEKLLTKAKAKDVVEHLCQCQNGGDE